MSRDFIPIYFLLGLLILPQNLAAQSRGKVTSATSIKAENNSARQCKDLRLGQILFLPEPKYSSEARSEKAGGTIEVTVKIDENGKVSSIEKVSGNKILQPAAIESAMNAKFVPTLCDGVKSRVTGVIVYNFYPYPASDSYFTPAKIEDFTDVKSDSQFFTAILDLTENYHLAFGYADGNFHAEAPLTRGDFAHFLRLTLEMISVRAKFANKNLTEAKIYSAFNPQQINSVGKIKDLKSKEPFYDSVKILWQNYDIALVNENAEFRGGASLMQNEVIDIWTNIFGAEAVPVNFGKTENYERIISRGDFALFLNESLGVLMYKILP